MDLTAFKHYLVLSLQLAAKELKERYKSTSLGQLWLLFSPLVTIFIYTVIFSDFMKMKLSIIENKYAYSIYLIPGLLSWNFFAATTLRLSNTFIEKAHLLKKVNIPAYVYFFSTLFSELLLYAISMLFGIAFLLLIGHFPDSSFLWLVPTVLLFVLFTFSLGVIIALFMPFFHDLKEIVPIVLQLWFWMTPIIYVKEMIAHKFPWLIAINPIYYYIEPMQQIFLKQSFPKSDLAVGSLVAVGSFFLALLLYKKMISHIKDML